MAATVTLSTTTFAVPVKKSDAQVKVASTSGLTPGMRLFVDRELMRVVSLGVSSLVNVLRGVDGTAAEQHGTDATVYIGAGDQFYSYDPTGAPLDAVLVSPWINIRTGDVFFASGDADPAGLQSRWWQKQTTTRGIGPLGVRTTTFDPTSST